MRIATKKETRLQNTVRNKNILLVKIVDFFLRHVSQNHLIFSVLFHDQNDPVHFLKEILLYCNFQITSSYQLVHGNA